MPVATAPPRLLPARGAGWTWRVQLLVVLCVAALVYFPLLGSSGLSMSEGPRVIPGWTMAEQGDLLLPHLFSQPYLRKPPGMPWLIALSAKLLGETELSARAGSAASMLLASLAAWFFARRWFGGPWGVWAGLAMALAPMYWYPGRSAEIEAPHALFCLLAVLLLTELLVGQPRRAWLWAVELGACIFAMAAIKGPSGVPCLMAVPLAAAWVTRSWRPLRSPGVGLGFALGVAATSLLGWLIYRRVQLLPEPPVLQGVGQFLWKPGHRIEVVLLVPWMLLSALPGGAGVLAALGRGSPAAPRDIAARTLTWSVVIALAIYTVIGVSNKRYAMPATMVLPLVLAYAASRLSVGGIPGIPRWFEHVSRFLLLTRGPVVAAVFLVAAVGNAVFTEARRADITSGRTAGWKLGEMLPDGALVYAGAVLDNRPEIGLYAQRRAADLHKAVTFRWTPPDKNGLGPFPLPPPGGYVLLMETGLDWDPVQELERYRAAGALERLEPVHTGVVHKFIFRLYRVPPGGPRLASCASLGERAGP